MSMRSLPRKVTEVITLLRNILYLIKTKLVGEMADSRNGTVHTQDKLGASGGVPRAAW